MENVITVTGLPVNAREEGAVCVLEGTSFYPALALGVLSCSHVACLFGAASPEVAALGLLQQKSLTQACSGGRVTGPWL